MNYVIKSNEYLKKYNTLSIDAIAGKIAFPFNKEGVKEIYQKYKESKKIIVIGKGSNILLTKKKYDSNYLILNFKLMDSINLIKNKIHIEAGATLSSLSWFALEHNIKGFEFLEDIPGTIGGALVMNAGTYKDNIGQLIDEISYYDIELNEIVTEDAYEGDFTTRSSKWNSQNMVIISCVFKTEQGDYLESLDKLLEIKKKRYLKQPRNFPNAGSVFKRPIVNGEELMVWKLINDCGLRGVKKNDAMISDKHTGFIVNTGNAKYDDIIYLIELVQNEVKEKYQIDLELEWKII